MARIPGTLLAGMPHNCYKLSEAQLTASAVIMCWWLSQLHPLRPPPSKSTVCEIMGAPFQSFRIHHDHDEYVGPVRVVRRLSLPALLLSAAVC